MELKTGKLSGRCITCKHWEVMPDSDNTKDMGKCLRLSGRRRTSYYTKDIYPDSEDTGIESSTGNIYDGAGFDYKTKCWFGCMHYAMNF